VFATVRRGPQGLPPSRAGPDKGSSVGSNSAVPAPTGLSDLEPAVAARPRRAPALGWKPLPKDTITALQTNPAFVDAFLVGQIERRWQHVNAPTTVIMRRHDGSRKRC